MPRREPQRHGLGHLQRCRQELGHDGAVPLGGAPSISVIDDGPGIPEAMRDMVLQRFVRLEASRTTTGSGLGLAIAAAIVKRHGATLQLADAAPGLRATIVFGEGGGPKPRRAD